MINSHIGWTDDTWNPIIVEGGGFYCAKVSAGCTNCYAEVMNKRVCGMQGVEAYPFMNMKTPPKLFLKEDMLASWARKGKPRKNFVSSMTDVFGEFVPDDFIFKILDAMVAAPKQIFQVLTKRSKRMKEMVEDYCNRAGIDQLPQNIWLMVSIENQDTVHRAIDLIESRCKVRGLSIEPLLGEVNLCLPQPHPLAHGTIHIPILWKEKIIELIDWIIVGGESGHKARMMHPTWAYSLQRQCSIYNVPFFFKQWGEWVPGLVNKEEGRGLIYLENGGWARLKEQPLGIWQWPIEDGKEWISVKVGRKAQVHAFYDRRPDVTTDNALLSGKHYFEFPKYLTK